MALQSRTDAFVEFDRVQKSYDGETLVVKELNLTIGKGEFLTMLGPSGSGKTTCLMMLAGFETATNGEIRLDGRPINQVPPHKRGIGMVFQNYALFPAHDGGREPVLPAGSAGHGQGRARGEDQARAGHGADGRLRRRRPAQLSGGQQQRIALARALVFDPKLVLMDEPLGALDKQLREHMQFEIKHLHESLGITVVYVTHDQGEALTMSDRIAVFNDGRIQQLAPPVGSLRAARQQLRGAVHRREQQAAGHGRGYRGRPRAGAAGDGRADRRDPGERQPQGASRRWSRSAPSGWNTSPSCCPRARIRSTPR